MSMTFEEVIRYLEKVRDRAAQGGAPTANAMARHIAERTANDTLRRRRNAPGQYYKAKRGEPPSYGSGKLAKSMFWEPASGGLRASAIAGSEDKRAKLHEFGGCVLKPTSRKVMHWTDSGGSWYHSVLQVDEEHPFLRPTVEEAIDDSSLRQAAIDAFREYDP